MPADTLYTWGVLGLLLLAPVVFASLLFRTAPYGRHADDTSGPALPARLGWLLMELPSPVAFAWAWSRGEHAFEALPLVFLGLYQLHYLQRTFVFPLLMRGRGRPMPLTTAGMSAVFNVVNGLLNGWAVSQVQRYDASWLTEPQFLVGVALFLVGMAINLHADHVLRTLRAPGEGGYRIPRGGLYRVVSSPNYLGEIIEWFGWALATWTGAGLAFAVFTTANLAPRARSNHRWYRERFADYPAERRALVPGLW